MNASQISRWDTATTRAGFMVLRRYEQLLGLPPRRLAAAADWTYRTASGQTGPPALSRHLDPEDPRMQERTEQLLEQALSRQLMTGAAWDELTGHLAALPAVILHPRAAWSELAERLLAELLIADGPAWLARAEALARLLAHPRARPLIIAACGSVAADPTTQQVVIEPMTILDQTADPEANRHILAQLQSPTSTRTLRGALRASVDKVARRHFRPPDLRAIAGVAVDLLTESSLNAEARQLAAAIMHRARPGSLGAARGALDPAVQSILALGRTAFPRTTSHVVARIVAATMPNVSRPPVTDPMLARLLEDLLFNPNINDVVQAGQLLAATPYLAPLGVALAAELTTAPSTALLEAMPWVGRATDRPILERFVLTTSLPAPLVETAAWRIGHVAGHSPDQFWHDALRTHQWTCRRTRGPTSLSALRGLIYALGTTRHHTLLQKARDDHRVPPTVRAAAGWWLDIPTHIQASAAHKGP